MKFDDVRTVQFWPPFVARAHPPYARLVSSLLGPTRRFSKMLDAYNPGVQS